MGYTAGVLCLHGKYGKGDLLMTHGRDAEPSLIINTGMLSLPLS